MTTDREALPEAVQDEIRALYGDPPISADAPELSMSMFASKDDLTEARGNERKELAEKCKTLAYQYADALSMFDAGIGTQENVIAKMNAVDGAIDALAASTQAKE